MRNRLIIIILLIGNTINAQNVLTISGQTYSNSDLSWSGVSIQRSVKTKLTFKNNSISSRNTSGCLLQVGDDDVLATNNNLDGAEITGNKITWSGTADVITHGIMAGYNINQSFKYNYLDNLPYGLVYKSGTDAGVNQTNLTGTFSYNIVKNGKIGIRVKGYNGARIFNNTFYSKTTSTALIFITGNNDKGIATGSTETKIFNNIFYTTSGTTVIYLYSNCTSNFECDYNLYYCDGSDPVFTLDEKKYTWTQWRALGYDAHSVIMNPNFNNTTSLVPLKRLDYGIDLGATWDEGLSIDATWGKTDPKTVSQNGTWQVGAILYEPIEPVIPICVSSIIQDETPSVIELTYNLALANFIPSFSAFEIRVNSSTRNINSVAISGTKVLLTLASPITYGDAVTVAYTKPFSNPLQTSDGGEAASFPSKSVTNNVSPPPSPVYVNSAIENSTPSVLEITYSLTLANIVPAISSFSVQVNSAARTISSVTVSGTKVLLTLASPVAYGNVIAVSYTVPSSNPLQTADGGKAVSISAKSVTNKINAPPGPVYSSSVIENATPSLIEITYNLSLANIVPAASAFSVNINSAARSISSVSISGTKVLLTLASPVVYGNTVTVAYTKPSTNPLQTTSGGQAATISAQTVTNKVNAVSQPVVVVTPPAVVNAPPVVVVNNISGTYSGFVGKINASGSYDTNKDNLTYSWKVPGTIPVSATNSSIIEFLAPIVDANQTYEFTLTVSDGKTPQTKTVPVTIIPYEPGLEKADVLSVEAASYQSPYYPYNILDGNVGTMWSVNGYDQWIILELNGTYTIQHVELAFQPGQKKEFYFDIFGSNDKENWEPVLSKSRSCAFSGNLQVFDFPASKTEKEFRYVKLVGQGNSVDQWNYIAEFRIFGYRHKNPVDYEDQIVKIYPNPAHELVNILIDEPTFVPDFIKIVSLTGKILFDSKVDPDIKHFQIPVDFKQGIYVVQMGTGNLTVFTQKLIVTN
jgi:uncharacterized repeat protein (TIGR02059 family)